MAAGVGVGCQVFSREKLGGWWGGVSQHLTQVGIAHSGHGVLDLQAGAPLQVEQGL